MQAAERIAELSPDLVLLDIQMPGASGLDVAASLGKPRPAVIFCTAFDQYAVDAFELSALDYLLKPVNRARLAAALDRVRVRRRQAPAGRDRAIEQLTQAQRPGADALPRQARQPLPRRAGDRGGRVHVRRRRHPPADRRPNSSRCSRRWRRSPAGSMPSSFFQVSRNAIIRLDAVKEAKPFTDGTGEILLANGQTMIVARRRWRALLDRARRVRV